MFVYKKILSLKEHFTGSKFLKTIRATTLGFNDGLVSNLGFLMGIVGASNDVNIVVLAGVAALSAGALSMAAGEYVSVSSQNEKANKIAKEHTETLGAKQVSLTLEKIYTAKGFSTYVAKKLADTVSSDPKMAREVVASEHGDLVLSSSAISAMVYSFIFFAIGAFIPLLPFIVTFSLNLATVLSAVGLSVLAFVLVGGWMAKSSGINIYYGAARMFIIGSVAALVTYGVGRLFDIGGIG